MAIRDCSWLSGSTTNMPSLHGINTDCRGAPDATQPSGDSTFLTEPYGADPRGCLFVYLSACSNVLLVASGHLDRPQYVRCLGYRQNHGSCHCRAVIYNQLHFVGCAPKGFLASPCTYPAGERVGAWRSLTPLDLHIPVLTAYLWCFLDGQSRYRILNRWNTVGMTYQITTSKPYLVLVALIRDFVRFFVLVRTNGFKYRCEWPPRNRPPPYSQTSRTVLGRKADWAIQSVHFLTLTIHLAHVPRVFSGSYEVSGWFV
jgi:hypothetical protein